MYMSETPNNCPDGSCFIIPALYKLPTPEASVLIRSCCELCIRMERNRRVLDEKIYKLLDTPGVNNTP